MSKKADKLKGISNSSTEQVKPKQGAQVEPKKEVQPQPIQGEVVEKSSGSDLLAMQVAKVATQYERLNRKYETCAKAVINIGGVVRRHEDAIEKLGTAYGDLNSRVSYMEKELGITHPTSAPQLTDSQDETKAPEKPIEGSSKKSDDGPDGAVGLRIKDCYYTGKMKLHFIHVKGHLDFLHPFATRSDAKEYDLNYRTFSYYVEKGIITRHLSAEENSCVCR